MACLKSIGIRNRLFDDGLRTAIQNKLKGDKSDCRDFRKDDTVNDTVNDTVKFGFIDKSVYI